MRRVGTTARGIRLPVLKEGDDIVNIVVGSVIEASASEYEPFALRDGDIVGVTESLLARAQGNYVTLDDIAEDVRAKMPSGDIAVLFPIMSRNRFYPLLKGIVRGASGRVHVIFSYPDDEVGNQLIDPLEYCEKGLSLPGESFDEDAFYARFSRYRHPFTDVDYVKLYKDIAPERLSAYFSNDPQSALAFADNVIVASIHSRTLYKETLRASGAAVLGLDDICSAPLRDGMGYNECYGLLGSNYTSEERIKLFPREADKFVIRVQEAFKLATSRDMEILVYGDGAFKDPVCGIWELADPVVCPAYTKGLAGTPSEIKFKYVADNAGGDSTQAVIEAIQAKGGNGISEHSSLGTTPRQIADLVGSLCDLTSGSGDKGTPVVHVSGYFSSYVDE